MPTKFFVFDGVGDADDEPIVGGTVTDGLNFGAFLKPVKRNFITVSMEATELHCLPRGLGDATNGATDVIFAGFGKMELTRVDINEN